VQTIHRPAYPSAKRLSLIRQLCNLTLRYELIGITNDTYTRENAKRIRLDSPICSPTCAAVKNLDAVVGWIEERVEAKRQYMTEMA
jgi:hypothetical protein